MAKKICCFILLLLVFSCAPAFSAEWEWVNPLPNGNPIYNVYALPDGTAYAVGWARTVMHYDGSSWSKIPRELEPYAFRDIWVSPDKQLFVVGGDGLTCLVYQYDGESWSKSIVKEFISPYKITYWKYDSFRIWGSSSSDIYLITKNYENAYFIFHYDGSEWAEVPFDTAHASLSGIWGTSADNVYIVGEQPGGAGKIWHYDGASWSEQNHGVSTGGQLVLKDIWGASASDIYVAGKGSPASDIYDFSGVLAHFDGTSWSLVDHGLDVESFTRVRTGADSSVYVSDDTHIYHGQGQSWSTLYEITEMWPTWTWSLSGNNLCITARYFETLWELLIYDGESWKQEKCSGFSSNNFGPIWGSSESDIYVGSIESTSGIYHFDGTSWSPAAGPYGEIHEIWGSSPSDIYAVGRDFGGTVFHFDGNAWTERLSAEGLSTIGAIRSVWGSSASDVYAVSETGELLHFDGSAWSKASFTTPSGSYGGLFDIYGFSSSDIWIARGAGSSPALFHWDGTSWQDVDPGIPEFVSANAIWGSSPNDIYVSGGSALLIHFDGSSWSEIEGVGDRAFTDIWGSSASDVYGVNTYGQIWHFDGSAWTRDDPEVTSWRFYGVWGSSAQNVYTVGEMGTILRKHEEEPPAPEEEPPLCFIESLLARPASPADFYSLIP